MNIKVDKEAEEAIKQSTGLVLRTKLDTAVRAKTDEESRSIAHDAIKEYDKVINGIELNTE